MTAGAATALVLAAHGESGGAGANARTWRLVEEMRQRRKTAVAAAFFKAEPRLEDALCAASRTGARRIVVLPLLMADGYFARQVLPARVLRAVPDGRLALIRPIGCEPALQRLAHMRARRLATERGWDRASAVVLGHGTPRDARSRRTTEAVAASIGRDPAFPQVQAAFLEEEPGLAAALAAAMRPVVIVPYLWSAGRHGLDDLRGIVEAAGRDVALDEPVGEDPDVARIVTGALSRMRRACRETDADLRRARAR